MGDVHLHIALTYPQAQRILDALLEGYVRVEAPRGRTARALGVFFSAVRAQLTACLEGVEEGGAG